MAKKGEQTRERIMDSAQALILDHGYGGVSIDQVIKSLDLTKGAFFHHFKSKSQLAKALIVRFAERGVQHFEENLTRARKLSDDPLQQFLIFIGLYVETFDGLTKPYEGCLVASYVYELQQFDDELKPIINLEFELSRRELVKLIGQISEQYPPRMAINPIALADMFMSTFEGAFILSKSLDEPDVTADQLRLYKSFITLLFKEERSDD